jgi:hypothetical protein
LGFFGPARPKTAFGFLQMNKFAELRAGLYNGAAQQTTMFSDPGMRTPSFLSLLLSWIVFGQSAVNAQFLAYNDHAPGAGTSANTTTWNVLGAAPGSSGPLKDAKTGANLPVTLSITTSESGVLGDVNQGLPAAGTPLFNAFNGYVDFQGTPNGSIELTSGGLVTYTFNGLNPNKRYSFMGSVVRGNAAYTDRWTLFELAGAISFVSAHTKNCLTNAVVALISPSQAALNSGVNNTAESGDMVVWENIDPGPEGSFAVSCQQYVGPVPNGSSAGSKAYGMTGIRLEEFDFTKSPATITNQPTSQTVEERQGVTFMVAAAGNPAPSFQWYKNDLAISGATNAVYGIPSVPLTDDGAIFKVIVSNTISNINYSEISSNAVLRVNPDATAPTILSVQAIGFGQVKVVFSERVLLSGATNLVNYTITGPGGSQSITNATLDAGENVVFLNVSPLSENIYTLIVSGISDQSSAGNVIAANTQQTFSAFFWAPLDIGNPIVPGNIAAVPGGYDLSAAGADIAGTRDQFRFAYQEKNGNFDMRVRVADLGITDAYAKAGLMVRETLADSSRFAAVFASSAQLGSFFERRTTAASAATLLGPTIRFPANYPFAWLRLSRTANDFTGFGSFDGKAWQSLGTVNMALPSQVFFGMAVTSGATNALTTAKFRDLGPTVAPTTFTYIPAREAIGPSNRRTGLIFSEIMYHAKPRADGRVLDFVEIYNGEPIFADLTGWRISGGIDFAFPNGFQLGAGQFVVIAADPDAIESTYGITGVLGPYLKTLSDTEDTLTLRNAAGAVRAEFTYTSQPAWPASPDGAGHSLVCLKPSYGEEDVRAWGASQLVGGSPGYDDPIIPNPWAGVVINEFATTNSLNSGFVELYNASNASVDLSGCFLTDSIAANKFQFSAGTQLAARSWISFTQQQIGFAVSSSGGTLYLISADQSRVLDAVRFGAQEQGVSFGRAPDGAPLLRRLSNPTPALPNSAAKQEDIVINEIMYKPVIGEDDDQYIELYNGSASAINLAGWRFIDGVDFTFPARASIGANGYLVVARNLQRMLTNYSQLNLANTVGDFGGRLKSGERIALAKPGNDPSEFITVGEVMYGTGGRWPELANGGGSSLELIDVRADPWFAPNWAASDESQKSTWATYEVTGVLNLANQTYVANKIGIMAHGTGEYLFDDIEVFRSGSTNVLANPGFESGQTGWTFFGTHRTSLIQNTDAFSGTNCLRVRATEAGDEGPNSVRGSLTTALVANSTYTLRAKARWISGWPEILLRVRGNGIELPIKLQTPPNLGTPGLPNSRSVVNAGPAITEVTHYPPLPAANEAVLVSARIYDPDGLNLPQVIYRVDPATTTATATMRDDGTAGDRVAGDGIYSATIPARANGLVAFRIRAQDLAASPASSIFPNDAPIRECIIRWADPAPFGSIAHYHLWSTAASQNDLTSRPGQDRSYRDCTIIYDTRTIYNAGWRNKGSPFHSGVGSYSATFPEDDLFLASDKHVFRSTGNGGDEATEMADDISYWIGEKLGLPFNHARYIRLYRNGALHYRLDYDIEVPDRSVAKDWFGGGGLDDTLYKIAGWFEYDDSNGGGSGSLIWSSFQKKPSTAPPYKTAAYRFNFQSHPGGKTANDYSLIFNLISASAAADKVTQLMNLADMEEWMRTFAHRRIIGDWDSWSYNTGQNMYLYAPLGERARLISWDMDFVLGLGEGAGTDNLFTANQDGIIGVLFNVPTYRRMLYRAYQDAVNGPLQKNISDPQFDSRQKMLGKNNVGSTAPTSLKNFVAAQKTYIQNRVKAADAANFSITTQNTTNSSSTITLTGIAPFGVATIEINGTPYPVTWTGNTAWSIKVPLGNVTNVLQIVGKDLRGNVYTNATGQVTVNYTGAVPEPADWVVINEIMYNAFVTDAEYIEILNTHPTYAFDLSGFQLKGADFTFPAGVFIQPNGYLVIAKDSASFASAYGATIPIVGEYTGRLLNTGERLALVKPGATEPLDVVIDEVHYESVFPWPATADGFGPSLQRIDATQDSWRAGNWSVTGVNDLNRATPGRANVNRALLDPFPQIWINELVATNKTGATDAAGEHEPWIELYNSGSTPVDLSLAFLSIDPLNPTQWQFPSGTMIEAGKFLVVWADAQPEQTLGTELHANFRLSNAGGLIVLNRLQNGAAANVDYAYYPASVADQSYGSIAEGNPETRRSLFIPTPGAPNNPGDLFIPVSINEWMSSNVRILADPADGDFDDWFELYNRGTTTVDLTGYFLSDETTNVTKFRIPAGYTIPPHGYLLVWADEETNQNTVNRADLHANFKLSKAADSIVFSTPNAAVVDSISFINQADNLSSGRYPDGASSFFNFGTATPRIANNAPPGARFTRILLDGPQLTISWTAITGRSYQLESKSDLNQPTWTAVGEPSAASATTMTVNLNFTATSDRFFRVVQLN